MLPKGQEPEILHHSGGAETHTPVKGRICSAIIRWYVATGEVGEEARAKSE
jgi:hypothetical protein